MSTPAGYYRQDRPGIEGVAARAWVRYRRWRVRRALRGPRRPIQEP